MKSLILIIPLFILTLIVAPQASTSSETSISQTDTTDQYIKNVINSKKDILDEQETNLHNSLDNFRDTIFLTNIKVITDTHTVRKIKEMPVYVEVPTYYKVVYSIYTPRGYHTTIDTIKLE